jgi:HEPN domain-containing protein
MTNLEMAKSYLKEGIEIFREAESFYRREVWHLAVRRTQEAGEMALKGALRYVGIEIPKIHDVGILLKKHRGKFPKGFAQNIDRLASISRKMRKERETSLYGDEETGTPPNEIYIEEDAKIALGEGTLILESCKELMGEI